MEKQISEIKKVNGVSFICETKILCNNVKFEPEVKTSTYEIKEVNEDEISSLIYEYVNAFWGKFPNLWRYYTKDDMAALSALDLYRHRKHIGIPNIVYYNSTKGERSLKPLISLVVYNVFMHEARFTHSTSIYSNDMRRNIYSPMSLDGPLGCVSDDKDITLNDILPSNIDLPKEIDYIMLIDSLGSKLIDNVYYKVGDKYMVLSYKTLLNEVLDGYNIGQISDKLFTLNKRGKYSQFKNVRKLIEEMKSGVKEYLKEEYNYTEEDYNKGWSLL